MAIITFDNFKFDNTNTTIAPDKFGVMNSATNNSRLTNTYTKNGYSLNGLDLSVSAASSTHGFYQVSKTNIPLSNTGTISGTGGTTGIAGFSVGFSLDQYAQSGSATVEPQFLSDMTPLRSSYPMYSADGMQMLAVVNLGSNNWGVNLYTRTAVEANTYSFSSTLLTLNDALISDGFLVQSLDGLYFAAMFKKSNGLGYTYIYAKTGSGASATYTQYYLNSGMASPTCATFNRVGSLMVGCSAAPFAYVIAKTAATTWQALGIATNIQPTSTINSVAYRFDPSLATGVEATYFSSITGTIYSYTNTSTTVTQTTPVIASVAGVQGMAIINSTNAPSFNTALGTTNTNYLFITSTAPYLRMFGPTGTEMSIPSTPASAPNTLIVSPNHRMVTLGFNSSIKPLTYKVVNNNLVSITNNYPTVSIFSGSYSVDQNYLVLNSRDATSQTYYSYDNNVNVMCVINQGSFDGSLISNYSYSNSRLNVCIQNEFMFLTMYDSTTGLLTNSFNNISATELGFDNAFTGAYFEVYLRKESASTTYFVNLALNGNTSQTLFSTFGGNLSNTALYTPYLNGPISVTIKRDINVSTQTTIPFNVSDFYITDGSDISNCVNLGPVVVLDETLTSDVSTSWTTTPSGSNHYSILSTNPPSDSSYVFTNTPNTSETIGFNNSQETGAYATKISAITKVSTPTNNGLVLTEGPNSTAKLAVNTTYTEYDFVENAKNVYVASANGNANGISVAKLSHATNSFNTLPIIYSTGDLVQSSAFTPDANYLFVGTNGGTTGNKLVVFKNTLDNFSLLPVTFTEINAGTGSTVGVDVSLDGKFLAVVNNTLLCFYYINGDGTFTFVTSVSVSAGPYIRFSKSSKYLFVSPNNTNASRMFKLNATNKTVTEITNNSFTNSVAGFHLDTAIDSNGTDYVFKTQNAAPYLQAYRVNSDDSITTVTVPAGWTIRPNGGISCSGVLGSSTNFVINGVVNTGSGNSPTSCSMVLATAGATSLVFGGVGSISFQYQPVYTVQTFSANSILFNGTLFKYLPGSLVNSGPLIVSNLTNFAASGVSQTPIHLSCVETIGYGNTISYTYKS